MGHGATLRHAWLAPALAEGEFQLLVHGDGPNHGETTKAVLGRFSASGTSSFETIAIVGLQAVGVVPGTVALDGKGFVVAGHTGSGSQMNAWVARADAWGNSDCTTSGNCVGKVFQDCADGNVCSDDFCTAAKGCSNSPSKDIIACDDGQACITGDRCVSGTCQASQQAFGDAPLQDPPAGSWRMRDVATTSTHTVVVAERLDAGGKPTELVAYYTDADGKSQSSNPFLGDYGGLALSTTSVHVGSNLQGQGRFARLEMPSAGLKWEHARPANSRMRALAPGPDDGIVACGSLDAQEVDASFFLELRSSGNMSVVTVADKGNFRGQATQATACIASPAGGFGALRHHLQGTTATQTVVRITAKGTISYAVALSGGTEAPDEGGLIATPDGGLVVAATGKQSNKLAMRIVRLDAKGAEVWSNLLGTGAGYLVARGVAVRKGGGFALVGQGNSAAKAEVIGVSTVGMIEWTTALGAVAGTEVFAVAVKHDGVIVAVGKQGTNPIAGKRWHVGTWGDKFCGDTQCANLSALGCDDLESCTMDLCSSFNGTCVHPTMEDGAVCGWAGKCAKGRCIDACSDKVTGAGETCDDGNHDNGDGCAANCQKE